MAATKIGVYYSLATGHWTHIKVPDFDWELNNPESLQPGEGLMILNYAAYKFFTHDQVGALEPVNFAHPVGVRARAKPGRIT